MIRVASILLILLHLLQYVAGQIQVSTSSCIGNGNYTTNSTYKANLDILLSTLPTNITPYGFLSASKGQPPDQAYAIVLCRGDVELAGCQQCVRLAATDLTNSSCPHRKQAISWLQDSTCTLRYSDQTIFGTNQMSPTKSFCNDNNAASTEYGRDLGRLLEDVKAKAMNGSSQRKFATGDIITSPDSQKIYALVQCSPDLTRDDCSDCLNTAVAYIPVICPSKVGGRILYPSCSIRYENYSFFSQVTSEGRLAPPVPQPLDRSLTGKNGDKRTRIIVIIVVSVVVGVILAAFMGILLSRRRKQKPTMKIFESTSEISTVESLQYNFSTIKAATNEFSEDNKLGEGGFGVVYKGLLEDGREIAVKRLSSNSSQGHVEFRNEALLLAKLLHRNLVRLLGFCQEEKEKVLVYEFILNGSLDHFIFDPVKREYLDWDKRFKIILGIAKGLQYLHEDSQLKIIHRDLKPSNVLLDSKMAPKISDFGLARLFEQDETHGRTNRIVGTFGYMPPEYAIHGKFSVKSDVFSFGVLVLEIITGQKNTCSGSEDSATLGLMSFVWKNWCEETHGNLVDPFLRADSNYMDILRCVQIGLLCVQQNPIDRPTMASVTMMLSNFSVTMTKPSQPAFLFGTSNGGSVLSSVEDDNSSKGHASTDSKSNVTKNEVSITDLCPR